MPEISTLIKSVKVQNVAIFLRQKAQTGKVKDMKFCYKVHFRTNIETCKFERKS